MPIKRPWKSNEEANNGVSLNESGELLFDYTKMQGGDKYEMEKRGKHANGFTEEEIQSRMGCRGDRRPKSIGFNLGTPSSIHYGEMDIGEYPMTYEGFKIYCYDKQIGWFNGGPTKPTYTGGVNLKNKPQPLTDEDIRNQGGGLLPYALTTLAKREAAHKSNDQDIQRFLDGTDKYLKGLRDIDQSYISELGKENSKTVDGFKKFCKSKIKRRQASVNQFSK